MRKFGLIGYPLGHSFSKKYFTVKFSNEELNGCSYENYPISNIELLPGLLSSEPGLEGLNVTIPYKSEVMRFLNRIDNEAAQVGAVNVIKIERSEGKVSLNGFNSDITGIHNTLIPLLRPGVKSALVLGTGGGSKAVCFVLKNIGINYTLVSRYRKPGCIVYSDIDGEMMKSHRLIINTTPLGMYPDVESSPELDYDKIDENHILFDLIYNPETTTFLRQGQERGATVMNGLRMLIRQAEKSWEIWNDADL
jgi:shikimate dehydrogenase